MRAVMATVQSAWPLFVVVFGTLLTLLWTAALIWFPARLIWSLL
jgi:hypothetical protein